MTVDTVMPPSAASHARATHESVARPPIDSRASASRMCHTVWMRALVYDRTQRWLTRAWATGSLLYRGLGRLDQVRGVVSWDEALDWLGGLREPISEIQYWGHGKWGCALVRGSPLDVRSLSARRPQLEAVREHLAENALLWFRTCETFGARAGQDFAERFADFFGARVAGHTHIIGSLQSGLQGLRPGERAHWRAEEGLREGTPDAPLRAHGSAPWRPRTITALAGRVPERWFASATTR
jgi:hypothetical protein